MGIWIRSQDRKLLLELNGFSTYNHGITITIEGFSTSSNVDYTWCLGIYSSDAKVDKILDMIQKQIENNWEFAPIDDRLGTQRLKVGVDKVFVMPQDSEVIVDEK